MDQWGRFFAEYGITAAVAVAIGWGTYKTLVWIGREVIIPFRDVFLKSVTDFFTRLTATLERLEDHIVAVSATLVRSEEQGWRIESKLEEVGDACGRTEAHILQEPPKPTARSPRPRKPLPQVPPLPSSSGTAPPRP